MWERQNSKEKMDVFVERDRDWTGGIRMDVFSVIEKGGAAVTGRDCEYYLSLARFGQRFLILNNDGRLGILTPNGQFLLET